MSMRATATVSVLLVVGVAKKQGKRSRVIKSKLGHLLLQSIHQDSQSLQIHILCSDYLCSSKTVLGKP